MLETLSFLSRHAFSISTVLLIFISIIQHFVNLRYKKELEQLRARLKEQGNGQEKEIQRLRSLLGSEGV